MRGFVVVSILLASERGNEGSGVTGSVVGRLWRLSLPPAGTSPWPSESDGLRPGRPVRKFFGVGGRGWKRVEESGEGGKLGEGKGKEMRCQNRIDLKGVCVLLFYCFIEVGWKVNNDCAGPVRFPTWHTWAWGVCSSERTELKGCLQHMIE